MAPVNPCSARSRRDVAPVYAEQRLEVPALEGVDQLIARLLQGQVGARLGHNADGTYFFDFIEIPSWDRQVEPSFLLRAIIPAGDDPALEPAEQQEVGSTIRLQNRMARINIALLGRGTLTGQAVYADNFTPVTEDAKVRRDRYRQ